MTNKKNNKKQLSKGRKSPLLIVRKKNKKGVDYHINTKTGKRASADEYRLQWAGGKRQKNKNVAETIGYVNKFVDKKDFRSYKAILVEIKKDVRARELRKTDINMRKKADTMVYIEVRNTINQIAKNQKDIKIKILEAGANRYKTFTPLEAKEVINKFLYQMNQKHKKMSKNSIKLSPLPSVAYIHDVEKNTITIDLKNLIGEEKNKEITKIFEDEINS